MTKIQQNGFLQETAWEKIGNFIEIRRSYLNSLNSIRKKQAESEIEIIITSLQTIAELANGEINELIAISTNAQSNPMTDDTCSLCLVPNHNHTYDCENRPHN